MLVGNNHAEFEASSDAGLIEAREKPVAEEWLQVRVDVHFLVLWVSIKV